MKNWRRLFALMLVLVLCFSALAGCSNETVDVDLSDEVETTESTVNKEGESADKYKGTGGTTIDTKTSEWNVINTGGAQISDADIFKYDAKGATVTLFWEKPDASESKTSKAHADVLSEIEKKLNMRITMPCFGSAPWLG